MGREREERGAAAWLVVGAIAAAVWTVLFIGGALLWLAAWL
jgi:hypothetical protein